MLYLKLNDAKFKPKVQPHYMTRQWETEQQ